MRRALTSTLILVVAGAAALSAAHAQGPNAPVGEFKRIDMKIDHPRAYHPHVGDLYQFYLAYTVVPKKMVENLRITVDGRSASVVAVADTSKGLPGAGEISLFMVAKNLGLSHVDVVPIINGKPANKAYRISLFVQEREPPPREAARAAAKDAPPKFGLGDIPVDKQYYKDHMLSAASLNALRTFRSDLADAKDFDARKRGWVTSAKNQGFCGSCWAFASVGTIESRILKDFGPKYDLSEQQQVSCNLYMEGCCGGSGRSLLFFCNNKPWTESDAPYNELRTECPTARTKDCADFQCTGLGYLARGFYTVQPTIEAMKSSLVEHGPCYFRYDVYDDFRGFWWNGAPGQVYKQKSGQDPGGHAVLIIGWSDSKKAWLLKNSWGETGGPNDDGTFWMAYDGHAKDLNFQMFNITSLNRTN